jgi:amidase
MNRAIAVAVALLVTGWASDASEVEAPKSAFSVVEADIPAMQAAMASGRATSRQLVEQYLERIARYGDSLHGVMALNPHALADADVLDEERARGRVRGPLHGIPIALKDIINTLDMPTTGGALAFEGYTPTYEATLVANLRRAGAVIIAKATLTELANSVSEQMPDNYSAVGGFGYNPYDPRPDPRPGYDDGRPAMRAGSSSSGIGTTANFWAGSVGTETAGSILWPSNQTMLVGIKPTVGRISRHGIMPVSLEQDTAGPMTKTVTDAAILLGAMEGRRPDPRDPATSRCTRPPGGDYTRFLRRDALRGARIGIPRAFFYEPTTVGTEEMGGLDEEGRRLMDEAIAILRQEGAIIVDPADIPSVVEPDPAHNFLAWPLCFTENREEDDGCSLVLKYAMKRDLNAYFRSLGPTSPVADLSALREFNLAHQDEGAIQYGQLLLDLSDEMRLGEDRARLEADRAKDLALAGRQGLDAAMRRHRLDAVLFPMDGAWDIGSRPGYPSIILPFGMVPNEVDPPFPTDFDAKPQPFGVTFTGLACAEPELIGIAYAFEQATRRRVPPPEFP